MLKLSRKVKVWKPLAADAAGNGRGLCIWTHHPAHGKNDQGKGGLENQHSTENEYPPPASCVCMNTRTKCESSPVMLQSGLKCLFSMTVLQGLQRRHSQGFCERNVRAIRAIRPRAQGRTVQVDSTKPTLKPPGSKHLKQNVINCYQFCLIFACITSALIQEGHD